ncbi:hypothetical protein [Pseudoduganella violacea]|uniref:Lipoprotein n=1 Tax=Pseudoduganella violacea TaxID=1715466 RepID=A0A7W5FS92_9BURK|nr:hypothetical protein [Pseudoduganella violacea]MBB3117544.1 hypothetical protein [Pseudoduganella violacea]
MRKILTALLPLLLAGCINDTATYYADSTQEHTLSVRRQQDYFWSDDARITLMAARLPDCQRQLQLTELPILDTEVELFGSGERHWSLRAGKQVWQVETESCALQEGGEASGQKLGVFRGDADKLVFEPAPAPKAAVPADAPAVAETTE